MKMYWQAIIGFALGVILGSMIGIGITLMGMGILGH
jgi:ABC-type nitrate/sulfonate/bicarbonate transport system permease component